ncbi:hypothetical protein QYE76_029699 [Lolium multiflorum]|uniref:Expansin-like CBD domain-containing protein n=1 Tax=Lolium multiflorum TaxID=4521 RepID=A0AAD8QPP8_LOLMU|nr:hypothetical protein QYE76_029699 [Lolium multiflorum]
MALPGNAQLRRAGKISILFRRVPCNWPGVKITFYVLKGANPYYLPVMPENVNRDGTVVKMDIMRSKDGRPTKIWESMYRSVGAVWRREPAQGAIVPAHHHRFRKDARRQQCYPGSLEGRQRLHVQSPVPRNRLSPRYINIATNRYNKHAGAAAQPSPKGNTREKKEKTKPTPAA